MGTPDLTGTKMNGGNDDLIWMQKIHGKAHTDYIYHSIQRTYLMEMDVVDGRAVRLGLRRCDPVINGLRVFTNLRRNRQGVQNALNVRRGRVMMVMVFVAVPVVVDVLMLMVVLMVVVVLVMMVVGMAVPAAVGMDFRMGVKDTAGQILRFLYFTVDVYNSVGTHNPTGILFLHSDGDPFLQVIHDIQKGSLIRQNFIQGAHQHITGGTHFTF